MGMTFLYVALGGALGSVARFGLIGLIGRMDLGDFPYAVLIVNILGSLLMGLLTGGVMYKFELTPQMQAFLAVGILGGFTTFSAFSLDVVSLMQRGDTIPAMIYIVASVTLSVVALAVGMTLMRPAM